MIKFTEELCIEVIPYYKEAIMRCEYQINYMTGKRFYEVHFTNTDLPYLIVDKYVVEDNLYKCVSIMCSAFMDGYRHGQVKVQNDMKDVLGIVY